MDNWDNNEFDTTPSTSSTSSPDPRHGGDTPHPDAPRPPPSGNVFWYVCGALMFVLVLIVSSGPSYEIVVDANDPRVRPAAPLYVSPAEPVDPAEPIAVPVEPGPGDTVAPVAPLEPVAPVAPIAPVTPVQPDAGPAPIPGALHDLVAQLEPSVVYLYYERGGATLSGTGFVINDSGLIVTNAHVVSYSDSPGVMTSRHQSFRGRVIARAPHEDLALVQADLPREIPPLRLANSDHIRLGDDILVMGFPVGLFSKVSVATGIVGSIRQEENRIQLSMAINPGNSGGPVFSRATGEVVAVVVSKHARAEGMGFSIPINSLKQFLAESGH